MVKRWLPLEIVSCPQPLALGQVLVRVRRFSLVAHAEPPLADKGRAWFSSGSMWDAVWARPTLVLEQFA